MLGMTLRAALRALRRNKLRSALTTLGIVIGVAAVIAMVSIGRGASVTVQRQIDSLGTHILMVMPGATTSAGVRSGWGGASTLSVADGEAIRAECPAVEEVSWYVRGIAQVVFAENNWSTAAQGVSPTYFDTRSWKIVAGEGFTQQHEEQAARVAILGRTVVDSLFNAGEDPIGATIRVKDVPFRVIGVLERKGQTAWGQDQDDVVLMPFSTAQRRVLGSEILGRVDMIFARARSSAQIGPAREQIEALLRERHKTPAGQDDDFTVRDLGEMMRMSQAATDVITRLLLIVASISLLVGGIGIMNILLVSVTERTREIGVRMAVGAKARHILLQFLVEATLLSLIGGLFGAALGIATAQLVSSLADWPTSISVGAVVGSIAFSAAVGVFFGFYPARKAARLDPIAALRYE
jgi:ABC-type antimicrobial peptide transport system permease subunit